MKLRLVISCESSIQKMKFQASFLWKKKISVCCSCDYCTTSRANVEGYYQINNGKQLTLLLFHFSLQCLCCFLIHVTPSVIFVKCTWTKGKCSDFGSQLFCVCVEVLRPSQPNGVMSSAVSLPNHTFTGQA